VTAARGRFVLATLIAAATEAAGQEEWQDRALCAQTDPEAFFPEKGGSNTDAKRICRRCPVEDECLTYALKTNEPFGVWGGMSADERGPIQRSPHRRRREPTPPATTEVAA